MPLMDDLRQFMTDLAPEMRPRFKQLVEGVRSTASTAPITAFKNLLNAILEVPE
jgi:hypothetical protein